MLRWNPSGVCITKQIYKHLSQLNTIQLPQHGSRSITPQANQILKRVWKAKTLPPLIKAFTWRLIRRALATADRAARYSTHSDNLCSACGAVENDAHLFFKCNLPRAVWWSFTPTITTNNLPDEQDGIHLIFQNLITDATSDSLFIKIIFTLWYIWKAKNDHHFNKKYWTPLQVHNATAAHIDTHS